MYGVAQTEDSGQKQLMMLAEKRAFEALNIPFQKWLDEVKAQREKLKLVTVSHA